MPAAYTTIGLSTSNAALNASLAITFGGPNPTDLFNLQNGGWSPSVAGYVTGVLGDSLYEIIDETIVINIGRSMSAAADVVAQLRRLYRLRDLAAQWYRDESATVVLLSCQPQGSAGPTLTAAVEAIEVELPNTFMDLLVAGEIEGVKLIIRRRAWLGTLETATDTAKAVPNASLLGFNPSTIDPCVVDLTINGFGGVGTQEIPNLTVLVAPDLDHLPIVNAESATFSGFSSTPTTASSSTAYGGSIVRILQQSAAAGGVLTFPTGAQMGALYVPGMDGYRQAEVWIALRNTDPLETWTLTAYVEDIGGQVESDLTVTIGADYETPEVVFLGVIRASAAAFGSVKVRAQSSSGRTGLTLDLDYLALRIAAPIGSQTIRVIRSVNLAGATLTPWRVLAEHGLLTKPQSALSALATLEIPDENPTPGDPGETGHGTIVVQTERTSVDYRGDALVLSQGATMAVRVLCTLNTFWKYWSSNLNADTQLTISATRTPIYPGVF